MSTTTEDRDAATSYDILFAGLVCFYDEANGRLVLLPNGRNPPRKVAVHKPYVIVNPANVDAQRGWDPKDPLVEKGLFLLPTSSLEITGAAAGGNFDTTQHDRCVPRLTDADPTARIDPRKANAIVRFPISSGTLEAFRRPNSEPYDTDVAIISRLRVEHSGPITVNVKGRWCWSKRRELRLKPGSDIAVVNVGDRDPGATKPHFVIYAELTTTRRINGEPLPVPSVIPKLSADGYYLFKLPLTINDGTAKCGNQGCCP